MTQTIGLSALFLVTFHLTLQINNTNHDTCHQEPFTGPCRAMVIRWYFNRTSWTCEQFIYGGCKNECVFNCLSAADDKSGNICRQPLKTGPCRGFVPRFWYNHRKSTCEKFTYGGCRGNLNNFADENECKSRCEKDGNETRSGSETNSIDGRVNDRLIIENID